MPIEKLGTSFLNSLFSKTKTVALKLNDTIDVVNLATDGIETFTTVTATTSVITNTITERTASSGVTVDGLLIKGGKLQPTIGNVTQITSTGTTVVLNNSFGVITMFSSTLAAQGNETFNFTNSFINSTSIIFLTVEYQSSAGIPVPVLLQRMAGSCVIRLFNASTATALNNVVKIHYQIIS